MKRYMIMAALMGGLLATTSCDREDDINVWNTDLPEIVQAQYPGAVIKGAERRPNGYEVEVLINGRDADIFYNNKYQWLYTEHEVYHNELPETVVTGVTNDGFSVYQAEDIELLETAAEPEPLLSYRLTFDREPRDLVIVYGEDGVRQ